MRKLLTLLFLVVACTSVRAQVVNTLPTIDDPQDADRIFTSTRNFGGAFRLDTLGGYFYNYLIARGATFGGQPGANGVDGADGNTIIGGQGAPLSSLGVDGDFYYDTDNQRFYGPKQGGQWGNGTLLTGPEGPEGPPGASVVIVDTVATQQNLPNPYSGNVGDMYISTDNAHGHVWQGSGWLDVGTIQGPQGPQGDQGVQGPPGDPATDDQQLSIIGRTISLDNSADITVPIEAFGLPGQVRTTDDEGTGITPAYPAVQEYIPGRSAPYLKGQSVTHIGERWIAKADTNEEPGIGPFWTLTNYDNPSLYLKLWRERQSLSFEGGQPIRILFIGDSNTEGGGAAAQKLARSLQTIYGDGGVGYVFPWSESNLNWGWMDSQKSAGWEEFGKNDIDTIPNMPFMRKIVSSNTADTIRYFPRIAASGDYQFSNEIKIFSTANGASYSYRVNDGSPVTVNLPAGDSLHVLVIQPDPLLRVRKKYTISISPTIGTLEHHGVSFENYSGGRSSATTFNIATNGSRAENYATITPDRFSEGLRAFDPHAVFIAHSTNDQNNGRTPDQYAADLDSLSDRVYRTLGFTPVFVSGAVNDNNPGAAFPMRDYVEKMRQVAKENQAGFIDVYNLLSPLGNFNQDYYTDGVHYAPNAEGILNAVFADVLGVSLISSKKTSPWVFDAASGRKMISPKNDSLKVGLGYTRGTDFFGVDDNNVLQVIAPEDGAGISVKGNNSNRLVEANTNTTNATYPALYGANLGNGYGVHARSNNGYAYWAQPVTGTAWAFGMNSTLAKGLEIKSGSNVHWFEDLTNTNTAVRNSFKYVSNFSNLQAGGGSAVIHYSRLNGGSVVPRFRNWWQYDDAGSNVSYRLAVYGTGLPTNLNTANYVFGGGASGVFQAPGISITNSANFNGTEITNAGVANSPTSIPTLQQVLDSISVGGGGGGSSLWSDGGNVIYSDVTSEVREADFNILGTPDGSGVVGEFNFMDNNRNIISSLRGVKETVGGSFSFATDNGTTFSTRFKISPEGFIGITTGSPNAKLNINAFSSSVDNLIRFNNASNNYAFAGGIEMLESSGRFGDASNFGARMYYDGAANLWRFQTANQTTINAPLTIKRDGVRVGIGTTNPEFELDVSGSVRATSYIGPTIRNSAASTVEVKINDTGIDIADDGSTTNVTRLDRDELTFFGTQTHGLQSAATGMRQRIGNSTYVDMPNALPTTDGSVWAVDATGSDGKYIHTANLYEALLDGDETISSTTLAEVSDLTLTSVPAGFYDVEIFLQFAMINGDGSTDGIQWDVITTNINPNRSGFISTFQPVDGMRKWDAGGQALSSASGTNETNITMFFVDRGVVKFDSAGDFDLRIAALDATNVTLAEGSYIRLTKKGDL